MYTRDTALKPQTLRILLVVLAAFGMLLPLLPGQKALAQGGVACVSPLDPIPSGPAATPGEPFPTNDHRFVHSSTALQGLPAMVKFAGGLLYQPPTIPEFNDFTSAVVVDNPNPTTPSTVQIDFFDHLGNLVGSFIRTIPPEGFVTQDASSLGSPNSGVGSARIIVLDGHPIVGEALLHARRVRIQRPNSTPISVEDPDRPLSTNGQIPGEGSAQQLQINQQTTSLFWGPLPLTNLSNVDFFNGQAPFFWVVNPNNQPNTITINVAAFDRITGQVSGPSVFRTITIPPNGTHIEKTSTFLAGGLFDAFISALFQVVPLDLDVMVQVTSQLPILGDGVMTDFFGDGLAPGFPRNLIPGGSDNGMFPGQFRFASTMLAQTPRSRLVNPDFSFQPGGIIHTVMGIFNAGFANTGPIRIEYFDRNGVVVSTGLIPNLVPGQSARIEPGVFGYPTVAVGYGWARITACPIARLVGWHAREILDVPGLQQYHKAYGDGMDGNHGREPGNGFMVSVGDQVRIRKVSPLVRTTQNFPWPGYTTFVNNSVPNIGTYEYRFFSAPGAFCGAAFFAGLPWAFTSTTLEDPISTCNSALVGNLSGRVDHTTGRIAGIHILGDPFDEFNIPGFAVIQVGN